MGWGGAEKRLARVAEGWGLPLEPGKVCPSYHTERIQQESYSILLTSPQDVMVSKTPVM